jgi:hypothetical protein
VTPWSIGRPHRLGARRRDAELAFEHVVPDCGVPRSDVCVQPVGGEQGRDASRGRGRQARATPESHQELEGPLEISVDFHGEDPQRIAAVLKIAGAKAVRTK